MDLYSWENSYLLIIGLRCLLWGFRCVRSLCLQELKHTVDPCLNRSPHNCSTGVFMVCSLLGVLPVAPFSNGLEADL